MITKFNVETILKDAFKAEFKENWRTQYSSLEFNKVVHDAIKAALKTAFDKKIKRFYPTQLTQNEIAMIEDCVSFEMDSSIPGTEYEEKLKKIYAKLNDMYNEHFD